MAARKKLDLLTAVEQIVEKAKGTGLSSDFYRKADKYIDNIARWVPPVALLWYRCFMRTNISYHSCGTAHI